MLVNSQSLLRLRRIGAVFVLIAGAAGALHAGPDMASQAGYQQQFERARMEYFNGVEGDSEAADRAQQAFASLEEAHPSDATVMAYRGSLELLEAARTWAVWNKHKLATEGLAKLDRSLQLAPDNLEVRYIHGETSWHLPFFYHRKQDAEQDFAFIAPRAESAVHSGALKPELAAAALDRYGHILAERNDDAGARHAFEAAVRVERTSPGGRNASKRLASQR